MKGTQERVDLMFLPQPWLFGLSACCFEMCSLAFHVECRPKAQQLVRLRSISNLFGGIVYPIREFACFFEIDKTRQV
jgi:hypothetical protein